MVLTDGDPDRRLGLNVPAPWWPTAPMLKGFEAAGFGWVQVHSPPAAMLRDRARAGRHAAALRTTLETGALRLVLHGPDDLVAGTRDADRALDGLLDYAAATGAEHVVYHGANLPVADGGGAAARLHDRLAAEEESLQARIGRLEALGVTLAVENLAPVWPGPPRMCHSPAFIAALVTRLDSPRVGMLLDLGHAAITGDARAALDAVAARVTLFHVHDNLGDRHDGTVAPGLDPLRLDLHLPPGSGRIDWAGLAPALRVHDAPLVLEVHPPHRPEPLSLAEVTAELLLRDPARAAAPGEPSPTPLAPARAVREDMRRAVSAARSTRRARG
ncbi:MAG: sugar phosphate isomerase/epimerase family protein [Solirubrobacteraceae bacterium]